MNSEFTKKKLGIQNSDLTFFLKKRQTLAFLRPLAPSSRQTSAIQHPPPLKVVDVLYGRPQRELKLNKVCQEKTH